MGLHPLKRIFVTLALLGISWAAAAKAPDFPPPPEATVEWVGRNLDMNGIRSDIRAFHTRKSPEKVTAFYRHEWEKPVAKDLPGFTETDAMTPWHLITRIEDGYLMTVQFQEADQGGTWGYLAMSPLPDKDAKPAERGKGFPVMPDSHVLSEMKTDDPGKKARTMLIANDHSVNSNIDFYRNQYLTQGWSLETDKALTQGRMHSLVFKSARKRITIMFIGDHNQTRMVINEVTHSIL